MRVFCPEHKRGFFAPRQSPVKCENRGHLLGEIDLEGQAKTPVNLQWQYCCNCEHFCPVDFDQYGLQRCPVCTRKSSLVYLCDRCYVISFESNTPLQTKNFTLTAEGAPQPSCPGCLRPAAADLHEHMCEHVNASFVTGLNTCPICEERLDIAPAFPSTVASYLKRTRSTNKTNVTFDYETGAFVPVEDGEFVVITGLDQPVVLPRASKFAAKRDFYEFYQDYYHCPNPDAGEVQIVQPALLVDAGNGWTLETTGLLEVIKPQPKARPVQQSVAQPQPPPQPVPQPVPQPAPRVAQPPTTRREEPTPEPAPPKQQSVARPCPDCGAMIENKYSFCWKCGHPMDQPVSNGRRPPTLLSSEAIDLDDENTVQHEKRSLNATTLAYRRSRATENRMISKGSVLKLISIATIAVVLVSIVLFGLLRSDTPTATASVAAPTTTQQTQAPQPNAAITTEVSRSAPTETTTQQAPPTTPEDELKKLREKRMSAKPAERTKIFQALAKVEKQYPRDYRFPYERAKLAVKGAQAKSKTEAFKALNAAAEKAINTGKANEMLSGLETDKSGDFSDLSRGRLEWGRLVAALKRKDPSLLSE